MSLSPGTRFGPYEILAPLGAGGMGEVYRAKDTKLDREVAVKVLPAAMARDRERLARFEREAKVLASLNHPNIAQIYGLEDNGDTRALIMELVSGATLAVPQPLNTALDYAKQIADALEAAHEKGITHRDLKPANIMITPEGVVKVLDFGLASIAAREPSGDPENSPTLTMGATQTGVIMGTAAYMSPEQAAGKQVDKRSDIWSYGVVLWEMLTGEKLFSGETISHTLADVLRAPLELEKLQAPAPVAALVNRCLTRDPRKRLRDIGEARLAIENYVANPDGPKPAAVAESRPKLPWLVAAAAAAIAIALGAMRIFEQPPARQMLRYSIAGPADSTMSSVALSPNGRYIVLATQKQLLLRHLDQMQWQPIPFTEGASLPFWSPDSRNIGFFSERKLKRVSVTGGPSQAICASASTYGASWSSQDLIVFAGEMNEPLKYVNAAGGEPVAVPSAIGRHPVFLPDGRHFLYTRLLGTRGLDSGVYLASLDGKENRRIIADNSAVAFAPGDSLSHIFFVRDVTLMALPFDPSKLAPAGDPLPVAENTGLGRFTSIRATVSNTGILSYLPGGGISPVSSQLHWYDRAGKLLSQVGVPGGASMPAISPDGNRIAYRRIASAPRGHWDIWLYDLVRGTETRFTSHESMNGTPFWSPKGDRIVFESSRDTGKFNLFLKAANGGGQDERILPDLNGRWPTQWSLDGRYIVYNESDPKTKFDLWVLPLEGAAAERKPILFLRTEFNEKLGQLSPDGQLMAFTSDRSGKNQIYVRPFPKGDSEWTVSVGGGAAARWRGDGKELFYLSEDGKMMAVPVASSSGSRQEFQPGTPVPLFEANTVSPPSDPVIFEYDVTPDGKRFLVATSSQADRAAALALTVVTNWDAERKK